MVDGGRLVLVIEDLHWADESMLAFLDTLVTEPLHAPILFLASARPELLTRDDTASPAMVACGACACRR